MNNEDQIMRMWEKLNDKLDDINQRVARVETMLHERTDDTKETRDMLERHERRISELEKHKSTIVGAKDIVTWVVMAGIALWGAMK